MRDGVDEVVGKIAEGDGEVSSIGTAGVGYHSLRLTNRVSRIKGLHSLLERMTQGRAGSTVG